MFALTADQQEETKKWMTGHDCPIDYEGAIGGKFTYLFTPTGIGVIERVSCSCGSVLDLTEYDKW
jgi:hypothetical protein